MGNGSRVRDEGDDNEDDDVFTRCYYSDFISRIPGGASYKDGPIVIYYS